IVELEMRINSALVFHVSILLIYGSVCPALVKAKILPPTLIDLIKNSDCIAEGKVIGISDVGGVRIAELEVSRIHKGNRSIKRLHFWASKTWACDISYAEQNESGLYFLTMLNRRESDGGHPEFAQELNAVLADEGLYSITWSGYGRLIRHGNGRLQASDSVRFPRSVSVTYIRNGDYSSIALVDARDVFWVVHTRRCEPASTFGLTGAAEGCFFSCPAMFGGPANRSVRAIAMYV
ncbi:MAG TPA: hypothetical protein VFV34_02140, partial [Blastocatellia bacterium]|nr:hypothetical protein [Blastocatellia bacterium]